MRTTGRQQHELIPRWGRREIVVPVNAPHNSALWWCRECGRDLCPGEHVFMRHDIPHGPVPYHVACAVFVERQRIAAQTGTDPEFVLLLLGVNDRNYIE